MQTDCKAINCTMQLVTGSSVTWQHSSITIPPSKHCYHLINCNLSNPTVTMSFGQKAFTIRAPSIWHTLPFDYRSETTISCFRHKLEAFLLTEVWDLSTHHQVLSICLRHLVLCTFYCIAYNVPIMLKFQLCSRLNKLVHKRERKKTTVANKTNTNNTLVWYNSDDLCNEHVM